MRDSGIGPKDRCEIRGLGPKDRFENGVLEAHLGRVEDMLLGKFAELDNRLTRIEADLNVQ